MKKDVFGSIYENQNKNFPAPPWDAFNNRLFFLAPGAKLKISAMRSAYEQMKADLSGKEDFRSKDIVEFIDFLFKHEAFGNIEFEDEQMH
jgi:hypothetical protein